jgi:hypothetical protein
LIWKRQKKCYFDVFTYVWEEKNFFCVERIIIVTERAAKKLGDLRNVTFQDDQDHKQRMWLGLHAVQYVFINRIEPIMCAVKVANV